MGSRKGSLLLRKPEDLVYRSCYAPVDLGEMLSSAGTRSRIRRLPAYQIFFSLKELDDRDIQLLLPHLTEEQWTGILDLDLWNRDRMSVARFLFWKRHILTAEPAVARKLVRATDPEMWELTFSRRLRVCARIDEEFECDPDPDEEYLETPDGNYLIILPGNAEEARLLRSLLLRLYELDPGWTALLLESCRFRTGTEIEETAYEIRTRRTELLGFQDYFEAIGIYSACLPHEPLPEKQWERSKEMSILPARLPREAKGALLLLQAFAIVERPQEIQNLVEELFYVCNKVLSADRISPSHSIRIKKGIRKAIHGINLGLDCWAGSSLEKAVEGLLRHHLQSFFQIGYGQLLQLRKETEETVQHNGRPSPGSFEEELVAGLLRRYPLLAEISTRGVRKRLFSASSDLALARKQLDRFRAGD